MTWYRHLKPLRRSGLSRHAKKRGQARLGFVALATLGALLLSLWAAIPSPAGAAMSGTWVPTGALTTARYVQTAALLPNGGVLVAGGFYNASNGGAVLSSAEVYDPVSGKWSSTGSMSTPRANNVMATLTNGQVLVASGSDNLGAHLTSAEIYNPAAGTWTLTGSLSEAHIYATATLLQNGLVLVAGGCCGSTITLQSAELYNPTTGQWSRTGAMNGARYAHTATLLPNGLVLVTGGRYQTAGSGSAPSLNTAELYNPATGHWTSTGSLLTPRSDHTATLLPNGQVLVAGGEDCSATTCTSLSTAELYDPQSGTWTATGSMSTPRYVDTATLLTTGKVLLAGGYSTFGAYVPATILYDPSTGQWTDDASLGTPRYDHSATLLPNGQVLVTGGNTATGLTASSELYTPALVVGTPTPTSSPAATSTPVPATATNTPATATNTPTSTTTATPAPPTATNTPVPSPTISGSWLFTVTIGQATSNWEAVIKQGTTGALSGTVEGLGLTCTGTIGGSVSGTAVSISWRLQSPCAGDVVQLRGTVVANGTFMRGSVADKKAGKGSFVAHKDR